MELLGPQAFEAPLLHVAIEQIMTDRVAQNVKLLHHDINGIHGAQLPQAGAQVRPPGCPGEEVQHSHCWRGCGRSNQARRRWPWKVQLLKRKLKEA
jgi:hypothetical protein